MASKHVASILYVLWLKMVYTLIAISGKLLPSMLHVTGVFACNMQHICTCMLQDPNWDA